MAIRRTRTYGPKMPPGPVKVATKAALASCAQDRNRLDRIHTALLLTVIELGLAFEISATVLAAVVSILVLLKDTGFAVFFTDVEKLVIAEAEQVSKR